MRWLDVCRGRGKERVRGEREREASEGDERRGELSVGARDDEDEGRGFSTGDLKPDFFASVRLSVCVCVSLACNCSLAASLPFLSSRQQERREREDADGDLRGERETGGNVWCMCVTFTREEREREKRRMI